MSVNATIVRIKTLSGFDVTLAVCDLVVRILSRFALLECAIATSDVSVRLSICPLHAGGLMRQNYRP